MITPFEGQQAVLDSNARIKVVVAGRRWGKSVLCKLAIERYLESGGSGICYIGPNGAMVRDFMSRMISMNRDERIDFYTANSDSMRGKAAKFLIVDTAEMMRPSHWEVIYPAIIPDGKLLMVGSFLPKIEQMPVLWEMYGKALDPANEDWESWRFSALDNPYVAHQEWEEAKRVISPDIWQSQIMSEYSKD